MTITTAVVCVTAVILLYRLLIFALRRKGDVKASGTFGSTAFYLEFRDRRGETRGVLSRRRLASSSRTSAR